MADDPLALLSRTEAYEAINDATSANAGASDRDREVVDIWVPAVSRRVDELCGPVVARTVTDERHDGGVGFVRLVYGPAFSITTVTEYAAGTATVLAEEQDDTLPANGYLIENYRSGALLRRRASGSDTRFPLGRRNVKVTYQAGRFANTASVDPKFKLAAASILIGLWSKYGGAWARGGDPFTEGSQPQFFDELSHNVKRWLSDELRAPVVL